MAQAMRRAGGFDAGGYKPFVYALLVHVMVVAVLAVSFDWRASSPPARVIQAVIVNTPAGPSRAEREAAARERARQAAETKRREQEAHRQALLEQQRKQEALKREQQAREQARQAEQRRREQQEAARRKQEAEAEAHRKREAEALQRLMAEEEAERARAAQAAQQARALAEADKYKALLQQKVNRNWIRPPGTDPDMQCTVRVRLTPGGEVLQATVTRSSGNALFDRSVENAIYKAAPLPVPEKPELFEYFREIEFQFRPEDIS